MRKSQGEIFGIALLFVVIIVGVIIYGQVKVLTPQDMNDKSQKREKYEILAAGTLDSILAMSTGCEVERGKDTVSDLIKYCEYTYYANEDPEISCNDGYVGGACLKTKLILNSTLYNLYNNTDSKKGIGQMPFKLEISTPDRTTNSFRSLETNMTNLGYFYYKQNLIMESNYLKQGFNKAPSGLRTIPTSRRNVNLELSIYFRE